MGLFRSRRVVSSLLVGPCMVVDDHGRVCHDCHHSCRCVVSCLCCAFFLDALEPRQSRALFVDSFGRFSVRWGPNKQG